MYNNPNKDYPRQSNEGFMNNNQNSKSRFIPIILVNSANGSPEPQSFRSSIVTQVVDRNSQHLPKLIGHNTANDFHHSYDSLKYQTMPSQFNQNQKYNSNYANYDYKSENKTKTLPTNDQNQFDFRSYNSLPKSGATSREDEVDNLTNLLVQSMEAVKHPDFYGVCYKCGHAIVGGDGGCSTMDQTYHTKCFTCASCYDCLKNCPFFKIGKNILCEDCHMNSLEKCFICSKQIAERMIRTGGKSFHSKCFKCVECDCSLDGMPFTLDDEYKVYCIGDYQRKCAVRCNLCQQPITQLASNSECMIQVVALNRNFHVACYRCEDCNMQLSLEHEERGCFPLDGRILCRACNVRRVHLINKTFKL